MDLTDCTNSCRKHKSEVLTCSLTTPELQKRKDTVVRSLKTKVVEKTELENGYSFKFLGTDEMLDELTEFIKTERVCCNFFMFELSLNRDNVWLKLTGPPGAKDFITSELGL